MLFKISIADKTAVEVAHGTLSGLNLKERYDLQEWVIHSPKLLGEDLLVITSEFSGFDRTSERLDVLALDRRGVLTVVELKRNAVGSAAELQALRYAAYCSTMSLHDVVELFADYESRRSRAQVDPADAERRIKAFVGQPDYDDLANEPRIILGAEEFSAEITATVLWLRSFGVDISCVRLRPYSVDNNLLLDSSVTIPLAEAREFQIRRDSKEAARALREPREVLSPEEFLNTGPEELRPVMTHMRNWLLAQPDIREEVFKTLLAYRQSSDRAWVTWLQFTRSDVRVAIAPGIEVDPTQIARTSSSGFRIVRVRTIADAEQVEQSIATARVVAVDTAQR